MSKQTIKQKRNKKLVAGLTVLILSCILLGGSIGYILASGPSYDTYYGAGGQTEVASYIIWKDDITYYAKSGTTGAIDYSGASAPTVIQAAIDSMNAGETMFIKKADYTMAIDDTVALTINKSMTLEAEIGTNFGGFVGVTQYGILVTGTKVHITGLGINYGNGEGYAIAAINQSRLSLIRVTVTGADSENEESGLLIENSWGNKILQCSFTIHNNHGIVFDDVQTSNIIDTFSEGNGQSGIHIKGDTYHRGENRIAHCYLEDNRDGIILETPKNTVFDCSSNGDTRYGVYLKGTYADSNRIIANVFLTATTVSIVGDAGALENRIVFNNVDNDISVADGNTVKDNIGWVTENTGSAAIVSTGTINHGLSGTPTSVVITPTTNAGDFTVSAVGGTTFTVTFVEAGTITFYWSAVYDP